MILSVHSDYVGPKHLGAGFCGMRRLVYSSHVPPCRLLTGVHVRFVFSFFSLLLVVCRILLFRVGLR